LVIVFVAGTANSGSANAITACKGEKLLSVL
jgi:hypothetical protein